MDFSSILGKGTAMHLSNVLANELNCVLKTISSIYLVFGDDSLYWIFSRGWQGFELLEPFMVISADPMDSVNGWLVPIYEFSSATFQETAMKENTTSEYAQNSKPSDFCLRKPKCNDSMNHWSGKLWTKGDTTSFTAFPGKIRSGASLVYHPIGRCSYQSHRESSPKASS